MKKQNKNMPKSEAMNFYPSKANKIQGMVCDTFKYRKKYAVKKTGIKTVRYSHLDIFRQ